jgi:ribose 5-phosphate isomerase A
MSDPLSPADAAKRAAAARALEMVAPGMVLGLGTGSTAAWFVRLLAERMEREALDVTGVATSAATAELAGALGVSVRGLEAVGHVDLTIDGADEVDPALNLIKGGGAALLREKIVAAASGRMVVIAGSDKLVAELGAFALPVEVVRFGWPVTLNAIGAVLLGMEVDAREITVRGGAETPLVTDEGHHILDLHLERIRDAPALARALDGLPGVVEHGLFIDMAEAVVLGHPDGRTEVMRRDDRPDVDVAMRNEDA